MQTHYDNLKVARNAPEEVIKAAYRSLAKKYHPDRNGNDPEATRILQILNEAYEVLSDPVKRAEHDRWIAESEINEKSKQEHSPPPPPPKYEPPPQSSPPPNPKSSSDSNTSKHKQFGRVAYFASVFLIIVLSNFISSGTGEGFSLLTILIILIPTTLRLRDIGTSGWWSLVSFIPLANLFFGYFLLCVPTGYASHRKADQTMKIFSALLPLFIISIIILPILFYR